MKDGSKQCPFCGSRFTFEAFELVDSMPADQPCDGCVQLYAILAASAKMRAALKQPAVAEVMDLSTPEAILARLRGRPQPQEARDFMRAAAGDVD